MQEFESLPRAIIRMFHVSKRYGSKIVLDDVSMDLETKCFVVVTGPSGAGKSTFLRLLDLEERVSSGEMIVNGMNLSRMSRRRTALFRRSLGIVFQDYRLIATRTVFDNVALPLIIRGDTAESISRKTRRMLQAVGLTNRASFYPPALSGGEQQRVSVARAMITDPSLILADEPTAGLDTESARKVMDLLSLAHRRGATVILATHDAQTAGCTRDMLLKLSDGQLERSTSQREPGELDLQLFETRGSPYPETFADG